MDKIDRTTEVLEENEERKTIVEDNVNIDRSTEVLEENEERKTVVENNDTFDRSTICLGEESIPTMAEDLVGKIIEDTFVFERVLSVNSGQSIVYLVKNLKDNKNYVCKLYRNDATIIDEHVVDALANKINSPYVIKIIKYGRFENRYYTITPYYEEGSVIEHIEEIDTKLLKEKYINQLNEGLHAIHEAGVMHCDIKPHNIFFAENRSKLIYGDFGIALAVSQFNTKKTTDGEEAIAKRDLQKKNATIAYLALEGEEYATKAVDYFALGMTILNMAYKGDVYADISDKAVRDIIVLEGARIPDSIDKEIAALVSKMTDNNHLKRLGYEGVKKWCDNPSCYGKYDINVVGACPVDITKSNFRGEKYNSTEEYTLAFLENKKEGLEYYLTNGIIDDLKMSNADKELISEIYRIKSNYEKMPMYGLALTLMTLNPSLPFIVDNYSFENFKEYISYLDTALLDEQTVFFDQKIILKEIENEIKTRKINPSTGIMTICNNLFISEYPNSFKMEMIRNYFTSKSYLIIDKKKYENIGELSNLMFKNEFEPHDAPYIFNDIFYDYLITANVDMKENQKTLDKIFKEKDIYKRNAQFAILVSNSIPTSLDNHRITCFADIIDYTKVLYENNKNSKTLCNFLRDGTILKYVKEFPNTNNEEINLLKGFINSNAQDYDLLADFYNKTQEFAVLIIDNLKIQTLDDLFQILGSKNNILATTDLLLNSTRFKLWLDKMGYKEAIKYLSRESK